MNLIRITAGDSNYRIMNVDSGVDIQTLLVAIADFVCAAPASDSHTNGKRFIVHSKE